jgi:hypothetical protein
MKRKIRVFASWRKRRVATIMTVILSAAGAYWCYRLYPMFGDLFQYWRLE